MTTPAADIPNARREWIWTVAKVVLAIALVGIVASQTTLADLTSAWSHLSLPWLLPSILLFYLALIGAAGRAWELIGRKALFRDLLTLTIVQTVVGNLVATSAGMVSFVTLLRVRHQVSVSRGVVSVLLAKLGDLTALLVLLVIGSMLVWPQVAPLHLFIIVLGLALAGVVALSFLIIAFRRAMVALLGRVLMALRLDRLGIVARGLEAFEALAQEDPQHVRALALPLFGYSLLNVVVSLIFGYCNFQLLGIPLPLGTLIFYTAASQLISLVPISVFGGLGVFEVSSVYLLGLFGIGVQQLVPIFLTSRIYFYALNFSLIPIILIERRRSQQINQPANTI